MPKLLIFLKRTNQLSYKAIKHGSVIENVFLNDTMTPDYYNTTLSENGRCCYPRSHIEDAVENAAGEPETVIFLTCDLTWINTPRINSFKGSCCLSFSKRLYSKSWLNRNGVKNHLSSLLFQHVSALLFFQDLQVSMQTS